MRLREINLSLSSLDILEPDFVLKIDAPNGCGRNFHFSKPSVKHLCVQLMISERIFKESRVRRDNQFDSA